MRTCIISFSSRKNGNCEKIGNFICSLLPEAKQFNFSEFTIHSCGKCDYECFSSAQPCPWMEDKEQEMFEAMMASSVTYFIIPNYCDYPCANFFTFNERRSGCLQKDRKRWADYEQTLKRAIVVSNTNQENFKTALAYHAVKEEEILFLPARKYGKISLNGDLMIAEDAIADVKRFVEKTY